MAPSGNFHVGLHAVRCVPPFVCKRALFLTYSVSRVFLYFVAKCVLEYGTGRAPAAASVVANPVEKWEVSSCLINKLESNNKLERVYWIGLLILRNNKTVNWQF